MSATAANPTEAGHHKSLVFVGVLLAATIVLGALGFGVAYALGGDSKPVQARWTGGEPARPVPVAKAAVPAIAVPAPLPGLSTTPPKVTTRYVVPNSPTPVSPTPVSPRPEPPPVTIIQN